MQGAAEAFGPGALRDAFRGKRVLVTGHTGFKGAWLTLWLLEMGAEVTGLGLAAESELGVFRAANLESRMRSCLGDLRDQAAIDAAFAEARPEVVFHLAAQPIVGTSYDDPMMTFDVNAMGTARVLEAARRQTGLAAVVIVTSDKCYENRGSIWGHREPDCLGGDDPYSASKACTELVAGSYRASFFSVAGSAAVATARAGNVIGGGDWGIYRLIPDCVRALRERRPVQLRNPGFTRPFQHVLDALAGYLLLGAHLLGEDGHRYASAWNFGPSDRARTVRDAATGVVEAWGAGQIEHTSAESFAEKPLLKLDSTKAMEQLGWRPVLDFDAAITWSAQWYREQHESGDADMYGKCQQMITRFESAMPTGRGPKTDV